MALRMVQVYCLSRKCLPCLSPTWNLYWLSWRRRTGNSGRPSSHHAARHLLVLWALIFAGIDSSCVVKGCSFRRAGLLSPSYAPCARQAGPQCMWCKRRHAQLTMPQVLGFCCAALQAYETTARRIRVDFPRGLTCDATPRPRIPHSEPVAGSRRAGFGHAGDPPPSQVFAYLRIVRG